MMMIYSKLGTSGLGVGLGVRVGVFVLAGVEEDEVLVYGMEGVAVGTGVYDEQEYNTKAISSKENFRCIPNLPWV